MRTPLPPFRGEGDWYSMDEVRIDEPVTEPKVPAVHADRRRPGRADFGNPALVELLRQQSDALHANVACHEDGDDLVVQCVNTAGKDLWKRKVGTGKRRIRRDEGNEASPSPSTVMQTSWVSDAPDESVTVM